MCAGRRPRPPRANRACGGRRRGSPGPWRSKTTSKAGSLPRLDLPDEPVVAGKAQQAPGAQGTSGRGDVQAEGITHMNAIGAPRFAHDSRTSVVVRRSRGMKTFADSHSLALPFSFYPLGAVAKPELGDKRAAIKQCKTERGKTKATHEAFKAKYHSFRRCVRQNAADEHAEKKAAFRKRRQGVQGRARRRRLPRHARRQDVPGVLRDRQARQERVRQVRVHQGARAEGQADEADDAEQVQEFKNAAKQCAGRAVGPGLRLDARRQVVRGVLRHEPQQPQRVRQVRLGPAQTYVDPISSRA